MRRNFSGTCSSRIAKDGTWRITKGAPANLQIIVIGADAKSIEAYGATVEAVGIEWRRGGVQLTMQSAGRSTGLEAKSAIVHESLPALYTELPLAQFDARAQRFWRRVFLLVRIPGGRRLLKTLAHASRNKGG